MDDCYMTRPHINPIFHVQSDNGGIMDYFKAMYGPYFVRMPGAPYANSPVETITAHAVENGTYTEITYQGETVLTADPIQAMERIVFRHSSVQPGYLSLHASAVSYKGKVFLFVAPTSRGKSTLSAYLSLTGCGYIADDGAIIELQTRQVIPYPRPLHLRPGSLKILQSYNLCPKDLQHVESLRDERYVFIPPVIKEESLPLGGIFFIEYNDRDNLLREVAPDVAFQLLLKSPAFPRTVTRDYLQELVWLSHLPCQILKYTDFHFVERQLFHAG